MIHMIEKFRVVPIHEELDKVRKEISSSNDPEKKRDLKAYENSIREFSVSLLEKVKRKEDGAFEDLMSIKDMRNFLYFYAYHIRKYHKFKYGNQNTLHEIRFQIFHHVVNNYRIYNEPHEISLLIVSMRNWIRQKVSNALKNTYNPKNEEKLEQSFLEYSDSDNTEIVVFDLMDRYLDEEEKKVFVMRFFEERGFVEIGIEIGASKDTAQRRYKRALRKFKKVLSKEI